MSIAAAYIRVSSERQDEYSPDSQIKLIKAYASKNGFEIPEEFIFFDDGVSAKSAAKRIQFNQMIALAKEKNPPFTAILVWKFSRFARNQEESIVYKNILRKKGVQVISISEPITDSPFGDLIERIIEWMDEYYLINLSAEVKRGMTEKLSRGEALCPPAYGYDIQDGKYIINPKEAPHVVEIFNDYLGGATMRQIALKCAAKGLLTHRGNPIEARTIRYILFNPVYAGKIRWSTDGRASPAKNYSNQSTIIVNGIHDPIINDALWNAVQAKLQKSNHTHEKYRRSEQPIEWMLKGLMRCECGATLTRLSTSSPSMQCHSYTKGTGKCVTSHYLSIAKANRLVLNNLEQLVMNKQFNWVPIKESDQSINYNSLIKKEQSRLTRAREAFLAGIDSVEEYREIKTKATSIIRQLEFERDSQKSKKISTAEHTEKVRSVLETVCDVSVSERAKNEALSAILTKIVYEKSKNRLNFFFHD